MGYMGLLRGDCIPVMPFEGLGLVVATCFSQAEHKEFFAYCTPAFLGATYSKFRLRSLGSWQFHT